MEKALLNIVGDYSLERDVKIDSQRTINFYILKSPEGKTNTCLVPMPGAITKLNIPGVSQIRGLLTYKNKLYAVCGNHVYQLDVALIPNLLGDINTSNGFVGMAKNVNQVLIVDGSKGYIWDINTATFSEITSAGFPAKPQICVELDGYFIVNEGETNNFFVSELNDGLNWDALKAARMISESGDIIIGMAVLNRNLFIFGNYTTEVWYDAGKADFPFRRNDNLLLEYGCSAYASIASGYQLLFWLAGDKNGIGSVVMTDGTTPIPISTPSIEYAIQQLKNISDARGTIYKINGHVFYELSFTTENKTFVYDATTKNWFEAEDLYNNRNYINCHAYFNHTHYVGSYNSGQIYELSPDYYTIDDNPIKRVRICNHLCDEHMRMVKVSRINLDFVAGTGIPNTEYEEVKIWLSISKDGGSSYGNKIMGTMGKLGDRLKRCIWRRLGMARDWVFKFEIISKNKVIILGASIDYEAKGR